MIEIAEASSTVKIRVLMCDGATAKTGLTVNVSIERLSDGKYWKHSTSSWETAYQANSMTELTGDAHKAGVYEYGFVTPSTAGVFDWRVTYDGAIKRAFAGRIDTKTVEDLPTLESRLTAQRAGYLDAATSSRSSHSAANVATAILTTPANTLVTNAAGKVTVENVNDCKADVSNLDATVSSRSSHSAADVWSVGARTLTSFGTLVADIWLAGTRTLTGFGTLVADIWDNATRTITGGDANVTTIEGVDATDQVNAACDAALSDYDGPTDTEMNAAFAALNNLSAAEVFAEQVDGLTFESVIEILLAVIAGKTSVDGSSVEFRKRDGSTAKITITYGETDGERTASVVS